MIDIKTTIDNRIKDLEEKRRTYLLKGDIDFVN